MLGIEYSELFISLCNAEAVKYISFAVTIANIKKALVPKKHTNPAIKVLVYYYKHLDIFSWKEVNKLAEH